jgi:hypothetical protein
MMQESPIRALDSRGGFYAAVASTSPELRSCGGDRAHRSYTFEDASFRVVPENVQSPSHYLDIIDTMYSHRSIIRITSDKFDFICWHEPVFR